MAENRLICVQNSVYYLDIRKAMSKGARTLEEVRRQTGICGACEGCVAQLPGILSSVCGCKQVSLQQVVDAVRQGADTIEKVGQVTGAGTECGRCKILISNIIALGR